MIGVITSWDIMAHPISTIRCFGWGVFFRAIRPWQDKCFLALLQDAGFFGTAATSVPTILDECIALEQRAKRIYETLGHAFSDRALVSAFFADLARQEQHHADLLEVCRAAALRGGRKTDLFKPWEDYLPRLRQQMAAAEKSVFGVDSVDAALGLVIQIESAEINELFRAAIATTGTAFTERLKPFHMALEAHISFIVKCLPELSPGLIMACRELRAKFPRAWA